MLDRPMPWRDQHNRTVLVGIPVIVAGMLSLTALAYSVLVGITGEFDESVVACLRSADDPALPIGPVWMAEVARDVTALGSVAVLLGITLVVCGFLWLHRRYAATWYVMGATLSGFAVNTLLKAWISRPRPDVVPHLSEVTTSSFPSSHAMMSAVVYLTLGVVLARPFPKRSSKSYFLGVALLLTGMVGSSRVLLGVHYPTDVLAGWSAGLVWATFCWLVAGRIQQRGVIGPQSRDVISCED